MPSVIHGRLEDCFEHTKLATILNHCLYIADLWRCIRAGRDAAVRDTDGMDKEKVAARMHFVEVANKLIHHRMMVELNYLYSNLEGIASDGDDPDSIHQ